MTDLNPLVAYLLVIQGRVQGVSYRASMVHEARARDLQGWVRNRKDGRVQAWVQGPADRLQPLLAWARRGPALARVDSVECVQVEPCADAPRPFEQRETV